MSSFLSQKQHKKDFCLQSQESLPSINLIVESDKRNDFTKLLTTSKKCSTTSISNNNSQFDTTKNFTSRVIHNDTNRKYCDTRCGTERKIQSKELLKWSRNLFTLIGLEHVSRQAAGPRLYKELCTSIKVAALAGSNSDFDATGVDEWCTWCGGTRLNSPITTITKLPDAQVQFETGHFFVKELSMINDRSSTLAIFSQSDTIPFCKQSTHIDIPKVILVDDMPSTIAPILFTNAMSPPKIVDRQLKQKQLELEHLVIDKDKKIPIFEKSNSNENVTNKADNNAIMKQFAAIVKQLPEQLSEQKKHFSTFVSAMFPTISSTLFNPIYGSTLSSDVVTTFSTLIDMAQPQNIMPKAESSFQSKYEIEQRKKLENCNYIQQKVTTSETTTPNSVIEQQFLQSLTNLGASFFGSCDDSTQIQRLIYYWEAQVVALNMMHGLLGKMLPIPLPANNTIPCTNNSVEKMKVENIVASTNTLKVEEEPLDLSARVVNGLASCSSMATSVEELLIRTRGSLPGLQSAKPGLITHETCKTTPLKEKINVVKSKIPSSSNTSTDPKSQLLGTKRNYTQADLDAAVYDIRNGNLGTRRASVVYGIPRSTLRNKIYKLAAAEDNGDESSKKRRINTCATRKRENTANMNESKMDIGRSIHPSSESIMTEVINGKDFKQNEVRNSVNCKIYKIDAETNIKTTNSSLKSDETVPVDFSQIFSDTMANYPSLTASNLIFSTTLPYASTSNANFEWSGQKLKQKCTDLNLSRKRHFKQFTLFDILPSETNTNTILSYDNLSPNSISGYASKFENFDAEAYMRKNSDEITSDSSNTSPAPLSLTNETNNSGDDESEKRSRPKRGQYRRYDKDALERAVQAVKKGNMSVHRAGSHYGVPHSTLEYKVKERNKLRPKTRRATSASQQLNNLSKNEPYEEQNNKGEDKAIVDIENDKEDDDSKKNGETNDENITNELGSFVEMNNVKDNEKNIDKINEDIMNEEMDLTNNSLVSPTI